MLKIKNFGRIGLLLFGNCPHCGKYIATNKNERKAVCDDCGTTVLFELEEEKENKKGV